MSESSQSPQDPAEDLLRRALIDDERAASVALRVGNLPVSEALTVIFHGRSDLGTVQTYVASGHRGAGAQISADELLRVPCDLDLGDAVDRDEAERLYADQARAFRDALEAADTVLAVWREPLEDVLDAPAAVDRSLDLHARLPAHRLLPAALVARDRGILVTAVCGARTLAEGRPPLGIACWQPPDVARVYPLPDDPERCLEDFMLLAAESARSAAARLEKQERGVARFLELNDLPEAG